MPYFNAIVAVLLTLIILISAGRPPAHAAASLPMVKHCSAPLVQHVSERSAREVAKVGEAKESALAVQL